MFSDKQGLGLLFTVELFTGLTIYMFWFAGLELASALSNMLLKRDLFLLFQSYNALFRRKIFGAVVSFFYLSYCSFLFLSLNFSCSSLLLLSYSSIFAKSSLLLMFFYSPIFAKSSIISFFHFSFFAKSSLLFLFPFLFFLLNSFILIHLSLLLLLSLKLHFILLSLFEVFIQLPDSLIFETVDFHNLLLNIHLCLISKRYLIHLEFPQLTSLINIGQPCKCRICDQNCPCARKKRQCLPQCKCQNCFNQQEKDRKNNNPSLTNLYCLPCLVPTDQQANTWNFDKISSLFLKQISQEESQQWGNYPDPLKRNDLGELPAPFVTYLAERQNLKSFGAASKPFYVSEQQWLRQVNADVIRKTKFQQYLVSNPRYKDAFTPIEKPNQNPQATLQTEGEPKRQRTKQQIDYQQALYVAKKQEQLRQIKQTQPQKLQKDRKDQKDQNQFHGQQAEVNPFFISKQNQFNQQEKCQICQQICRCGKKKSLNTITLTLQKQSSEKQINLTKFKAKANLGKKYMKRQKKIEKQMQKQEKPNKIAEKEEKQASSFGGRLFL